MTYLTTKALKAEMLVMFEALHAEIAALRAVVPSAGPVVVAIRPPDPAQIPLGDVVANIVPNVMPPVTAEWGVGATIRRKGVLSDPPHTVTLAGVDWVRAQYTRPDGSVSTFEGPPIQYDLITAAPGST
jgi:hypothetical protein